LNAVARARGGEWELGYYGDGATVVALSTLELMGGTILEPVSLPVQGRDQ
jgi:hypothetical protein